MAPFAGLVFLSILPATQFNVCVEDRVGLTPAARREFAVELGALAPRVNLGPSDRGSGCIQIRIRATPPPRYPTALGLAYREADRILPRIDVYMRPIERILGGALHARAVGRAVARVAAHELAHYLQQRTSHDCDGLLRPGFDHPFLTGALARAQVR